MKKAALLMLAVLLLLPMLATAANMQVNSSAVPVSGGTISPNGIKFYNGVAAVYTATAKPGWTLTSVLIDGVAATAPYTVPFDTSKVHTVKANFAQTLYSITTTAGAGGSVSVTGGGSTNITPGSTRGYIVAPGTGSQIVALTVDGTSVIPANPLVAYSGSFLNIQANHTVAATFTTLPATATVVNAGSDQTIDVATTVLNGSTSVNPVGATISWSGAGLTFTPSNALSTAVTGMTVPNGVYPNLATKTYTATLTVNGVTDSVTITVNPAGILTCSQCHAGTAAVSNYPKSVHYTGTANSHSTCAACHNGTTGVHKAGNVNASTVNPATFTVVSGASVSGPYGPVAGKAVFCSACHSGQYAAPHVVPYPGKTCVQCHTTSGTGDAHSIIAHPTAASEPDCATCHATQTLAAPHYGGTAFIEAQYVSAASLPVSCSNCHGDLVNTTANRAILAQYTSSAHGSPLAEAWRHYDWRSSSRASCQRCHAGTAFVAKLGNENNTTNAYQPTDILKPGEVLNCSACHTDAGTGALRTAAQQFTINMSNGATVTYNVPGASTLCARCHGGRETGNSIKADTNANGVRGFIDSHYLVAAGTVFNKGGYEYAGQNYDTLGYHKYVGTGVSGTGSQGPCVACHMGLGTANHTWKVANSNACGNCHSNPTAAKLAQAKANYQAALDSLRLALQAKGIYYDVTHPYFFTAPYDPNKAVYDPANPTAANTPFTNWASVYGLSSWKDVMGAAFNYRMLVNDPGAYAHNKQYALKLIADSCDFLADGGLDGQGIPAAVTTAINSVAFGLK